MPGKRGYPDPRYEYDRRRQAQMRTRPLHRVFFLLIELPSCLEALAANAQTLISPITFRRLGRLRMHGLRLLSGPVLAWVLGRTEPGGAAEEAPALDPNPTRGADAGAAPLRTPVPTRPVGENEGGAQAM